MQAAPSARRTSKDSSTRAEPTSASAPARTTRPRTTYYGGPTFGLQHTSVANLPGDIEASFASIDGQLPAVIIYRNLLLTSVHLEAFENDESTGLGTADRIENYRYLATLINRVAQTNFKIPGGSP